MKKKKKKKVELSLGQIATQDHSDLRVKWYLFVFKQSFFFESD
jgi:hypothetical protein